LTTCENFEVRNPNLFYRLAAMNKLILHVKLLPRIKELMTGGTDANTLFEAKDPANVCNASV
jgi:hypothetical protein